MLATKTWTLGWQQEGQWELLHAAIFSAILLQTDGHWRLETTELSFLVFSDYLCEDCVQTWGDKGKDWSLRVAEAEERRGRMICGGVVREILLDLVQTYRYLVEREETLPKTRVIINISAVNTSVVTQGNTLWNKMLKLMCRWMLHGQQFQV